MQRHPLGHVVVVAPLHNLGDGCRVGRVLVRVEERVLFGQRFGGDLERRLLAVLVQFGADPCGQLLLLLAALVSSDLRPQIASLVLVAFRHRFQVVALGLGRVRTRAASAFPAPAIAPPSPSSRGARRVAARSPLRTARAVRTGRVALPDRAQAEALPVPLSALGLLQVRSAVRRRDLRCRRSYGLALDAGVDADSRVAGSDRVGVLLWRFDAGHRAGQLRDDGRGVAVHVAGVLQQGVGEVGGLRHGGDGLGGLDRRVLRLDRFVDLLGLRVFSACASSSFALAANVGSACCWPRSAMIRATSSLSARLECRMTISSGTATPTLRNSSACSNWLFSNVTCIGVFGRSPRRIRRWSDR